MSKKLSFKVKGLLFPGNEEEPPVYISLNGGTAKEYTTGEKTLKFEVKDIV